jgi:hypothetical protein
VGTPSTCPEHFEAHGEECRLSRTAALGQLRATLNGASGQYEAAGEGSTWRLSVPALSDCEFQAEGTGSFRRGAAGECTTRYTETLDLARVRAVSTVSGTLTVSGTAFTFNGLTVVVTGAPMLLRSGHGESHCETGTGSYDNNTSDRRDYLGMDPARAQQLAAAFRDAARACGAALTE